MRFTIFSADCVGNRKNCLYPNRQEITDKEKLRAAVSFDHVCAEYEGDYRSVSNYKESNVAVMDVDNDHSDDPQQWITPENLADEFGDLDYAIAFSRNHLKSKEGKSPRPRFHVYFAITPFADAEGYTALKREIYRNYPFFDGNALDAGRFIFGCDPGNIIWHEGQTTIDRILERLTANDDIEEGRRNATLSRIAGRLVKRYGAGDESYRMFLAQAERCSPPLEDQELSTIWKSACRFAKKVQAQPGYIPPEQFGGGLMPVDFTDIDEAKVFCMDAASEITYTTGTDFLCYNGVYWEESRIKAQSVMMKFLDRQRDDAASNLEGRKAALLSEGVSELAILSGGKALERQIGSNQMNLYLNYQKALSYYKFVINRRNMKYVCSTLEAARSMVELAPADFDRAENLLNCPEHTYDVSRGLAGIRDHDPSDLITKSTRFEPGDQGSELWDQALHTFFGQDEELIDYVQQTVGLCAIGAVYQEAMIIAYGEGSNGKSTFWNTIAGSLGSYSGTISADALTVGCRRNVRPELAEVKGKRLLIAAELEEGTRLSTSIVKQLCSTDEISAEKKYRDPFKFRPTHTLVLYTNHLPKVGAMDTGIWRRLIVIPFDARITGRSDIKNYSKYLLEHAGPAVMRWIIEGAQRVIAADYHLRQPLCVAAAIAQYRADNDWLAHFLDSCCVVEDDREEKSGELYTAYRAFCARSGEYARGTTEFYTALDQRGFQRVRRKTGRFVTGLTLCDFID
ncbi:MAG: primase C-terminal domain-containing protein [Oscillospiraceae bacterium]|nr:primase C-terminal domain-containing protein [Oscillospiraceae bacterium]